MNIASLKHNVDTAYWCHMNTKKKNRIGIVAPDLFFILQVLFRILPFCCMTFFPLRLPNPSSSSSSSSLSQNSSSTSAFAWTCHLCGHELGTQTLPSRRTSSAFHSFFIVKEMLERLHLNISWWPGHLLHPPFKTALLYLGLSIEISKATTSTMITRSTEDFPKSSSLKSKPWSGK